MKSEVQEILDRYCEEYDDAETNQAPSGEWAEYNIEYLQKESAACAVEEMGHAIGSCGECEMYSQYVNRKGCLMLGIDKGSDWYCGDFKRKDKGDSDESGDD